MGYFTSEFEVVGEVITAQVERSMLRPELVVGLYMSAALRLWMSPHHLVSAGVEWEVVSGRIEQQCFGHVNLDLIRLA